MPDVLTWLSLDAKNVEIAGHQIETLGARVPGGWLHAVSYLPLKGDGKTIIPGGATFVPDPEHEWKGD
jgi:hypothetical protein